MIKKPSQFFYLQKSSPNQRLMILAGVFLFFVTGILLVSFLLGSFSLNWLILPISIIFALFAILNNFQASRINLEQELTAQELKAIINNLPDGLIIYNPDLYITAFNSAAEKIFQLKAAEVLNKKIEPVLAKNPRFQALTQIIFPSLAPSIKQISEVEQWPQVVDLTLENPPLEIRTVLFPTFNQNGKILNFIKIVHDQTREKNILKSKNEFINVAAHQLRTPLTAINWLFENLLSLTDLQEIKNSCQNGLQIAQRAIKIVEDLLRTAQIEEGRFGYLFEETNLIEFIQALLDKVSLLAKNKEININFEKPSEEIKVKIDQQKLGIAFINLLENAIKYNFQKGSLTIKVEKLTAAPFVKISFQDTGVGIPPQDLKKIFQKFFRGSNAVPLEPNGSGLGLYIAKNIIEQHGGQITVQSILGRGTTFHLTLPLDPTLIPLKERPLEEF